MNSLETAQYEALIPLVRARDFGAPFRTLLDSAWAYRVGGPFLNSNSRPHWFNRPCPTRHGNALRKAPFVSVGASRVLAGVDDQDLVRDHAIPISIIRDILFRRQPATVEQVREIVGRYYAFGVLTSFEDKLLTAAGLRSRMPDGWREGQNLFARYAAVGIIAQDLRPRGDSIRYRAPTREKRVKSKMSTLLASVSSRLML